MRIANRAGAALLTGALIVLVFVVAIFRRNAAEFKREQDASEHFQLVIDAAQSTLSALKDAETGQRGFLLTGKSSYLQPYEAGRNYYAQSIAQLRQLTLDDARVSAMVGELETASRRKLSELAATVALANANRRAEAVGRVNQDIGKVYMDQIRSAVSRIVSFEESAFGVNAKLLARSEDYFRLEVLIAAAVLFLLTLTGTILLSMEIRFERRLAVNLEASEKKYRHLAETLEEQVAERTNELQQVNRELNAFAYSVSHDLRAPLRAVDGFSQMVLEDYQDRLDDSGRDMLNRIRNGAKRMGQLIQSLLELSRLGREDLNRKRVSLTGIAESVVESLASGSPERKVNVTIAPDLTAEADEHLIRVVFDNLLSNSWKFTARTEAPAIDVGKTRSGDKEVFYVRDNGAGFDPAYAGKLFTPFQRLHTASDFEGIGIGLATVQRVIHRHGGRVWAEGKPGEGATFYFTL